MEQSHKKCSMRTACKWNNHDPRRTLDDTRICIGSKQKPRDILPGVKSSPSKNNYAFKVVAFFFLRQPSRPNAPRPEAKRGRAAGKGMIDTKPSKLTNSTN